MTEWIGRFCFRHRWKVIIASVLLMVGGFACAGRVMGTVASGERSYAPESVQAHRVLRENGDHGGRVVALIDRVDPSAPRTRAALMGLFGSRVRPSKRAVLGSDGAGAAGTDSGFFAGTARFIQRRPLVMTIVIVGLLVGAAAPLLGTARRARPPTNWSSGPVRTGRPVCGRGSRARRRNSSTSTPCCATDFRWVSRSCSS